MENVEKIINDWIETQEITPSDEAIKAIFRICEKYAPECGFTNFFKNMYYDGERIRSKN